MEQSREYSKKMSKSLTIKPNFQHDIINPTIYLADNFQLIMQNYQQPKPQRAVIQAKKKRVQSVVQRIVSKKTIQPSKKKPFYEHKPAKIYKPVKKISKTHQKNYQLDNMYMDIDQRINEKALMLDEDLTAHKDMLKEILKKINQCNPNSSQKNIEQDVQFYLTSIQPKKKRYSNMIVRPENQKQVIQKIGQNVNKLKANTLKTSQTTTTRPQTAFILSEKVQPNIKYDRTRKNSEKNCKNNAQLVYDERQTTKKRPQTAKNFTRSTLSAKTLTPYQLIHRRNSLTNTKLGRYKIGTDILENTNKNSQNKAQKQIFEQIANNIQISTLHNNINMEEITDTMKKMGKLWKTQEQFLQIGKQTNIMTTKSKTLDTLIAKRKKQNGYQNIDNIFMNN